MRVLFVCYGNICRSPTALGVFRHVAREQVPDLFVDADSAGTHDFHVGSPPDPRSVAAALRRGIDLSQMRARTVEPADFERFDLILVMDEQNRQELHTRAASMQRDRIRLVMDYAPDAAKRAVPDPYYGGPQGFEEVLDLLTEASEGLLREILASSK